MTTREEWRRGWPLVLATMPSRSFPVSPREGIHSRQFWQLVLTALLGTGLIVGLVVHLVPMLGELGLPRETAVGIVSTIGIMSVLARLTFGFPFDRLPARRSA